MNRKSNFMNPNSDYDEFSVYSEVVEKNYSNFLERKNIGENEDIIRCLKRIIFGKGQLVDCDSLEILIPTFKMLIEDVCGMSLEDYESSFAVGLNKKIHAENISRKITLQASDDIKEECIFDRKSILFKMVWPDYYEKNFVKFSYNDIYHVKGELKSGLIRAARPLNENETDRKNSDGAVVDRIVYKAIKHSFASTKWNTDYKILKVLADEENLNTIGKKTTPGVLLVIKERECYQCALDFYFLNMPREEQMKLVDYYMELREEYGKPKQDVLDIMYKTFKDNKEAFLATLDY